ADATRLLPVSQQEIAVAVALHARIELAAERRERVLARAMEMPRVLGEAVDRRQIHAAAEPPGRAGLVGRVRGEMADVQVHDRRVRIARMQGEVSATRTQRTTRQLWTAR